MRILIVGGGIAGLTLAALIRQRDQEPLVVEKVGEYRPESGYLLGLWPLGSRVLRGLHLTEHYRASSAGWDRYELHDERGNLLKGYRVGDWIGRYGDARMIMRSDLLELLRSSGGGIPVAMGTTVERLEQRTGEGLVRARLSNGAEGEFDLVVGADGIHSLTRTLLFGAVPLARTGLTLWSWWFNGEGYPREAVREVWGSRGKFFGVYPAKGCVACAAVLPEGARPRSEIIEGRRALLRERFADFGGALVRGTLDRLGEVSAIDRTALADVKLRRWYKGRVLLIGDAAAAFLPTAGVGASMAMESAAVLADELSRADAAHVPEALRLFVKRRRRRVDTIQAASRHLLTLAAGIEAPAAVAARDAVLRLTPERLVSWEIARSMGQLL